MIEDAPVLLHMEVTCSPRAPAAIREALAGIDRLDGIRDDAMLVATELVSNAVLHSGCAPDDTLEFVLRFSDHPLISVRDPGTSGGRAEVAGPREPGFGGLGLRIVEELSMEWGQRYEAGYQVWAELPACPPRALH